MQFTFLRVCKYLSKRIRRTGQIYWKSYKGVLKPKKKKNKGLSFITQFNFFKNLNACKAEQPLQGMELQEKEAQQD